MEAFRDTMKEMKDKANCFIQANEMLFTKVLRCVLWQKRRLLDPFRQLSLVSEGVSLIVSGTIGSPVS